MKSTLKQALMKTLIKYLIPKYLYDRISFKKQTNYSFIKWTDLEGNYHRINKPALIYSDGTEYWYNHGKLHREDGPAIHGPEISTNGSTPFLLIYDEYYIHGKEVTEKKIMLKNRIKKCQS